MENERTYGIKFHRDYNEIDSEELREPSHSNSVQQFINMMYEEFKNCFEQKNFSRIEKIIKNIENVDVNANVLNCIYGHLCLVKGEGKDAYNYIFKYVKNATIVDAWVSNSMAMWNLIIGNYPLALKQFTQGIEGVYSDKYLVSLLINLAKTKKRMGFLDRALEYYERIMCIPHGFQLYLLIKLEIIHICILKRSYEAALKEIESYAQLSNNYFIKRLKIYIMFVQKNYKEILKYKKDENCDPYIAYIIARIGLENSRSINIDIPYYLDLAIKGSQNNKYIYNTYGNYYSNIGRYSDAAEYYNNALCLDPKFTSALENMSLFVQANTTSNQPIYIAKDDGKGGQLMLSDVNPDVESLGFLNTWNLLGYKTFHIDYLTLKKMPPLRFYILDE